MRFLKKNIDKSAFSHYNDNQMISGHAAICRGCVRQTAKRRNTMKKIAKGLLLILLVLAMVLSAVACKRDDQNPDDDTAQKTVQVIFVSDGQTVKSLTVNKGAVLAAGDIPAAPAAAEGYEFIGWYAGGVKVEAGYEVGSANVTVEAKFERTGVVKHTLTFRAEGKEDVVITVADGEKPDAALLPGSPADELYAFDGWYNGETAFDANAAVTADAVYVARLHRIAYRVTFSCAGQADVAVIVPIGGTTALTAEQIPAAPSVGGATFLGWYNGEVKAEAGVAVTADTVYTAKFAEVIHTLTFRVAGKEDVVIAVVEGAKPDAAKLPRDPDAGAAFNFDGWFDADGEEFDRDAVVVKDAVYTAAFSRIGYLVTFRAEGQEDIVVLIPIGETTVLAADKIPAAPAAEGLFLGWYADSVKAVADLAIDRDLVFVARFANKAAYIGVWYNLKKYVNLIVDGENVTLAGVTKALADLELDEATGELVWMGKDSSGRFYDNWFFRVAPNGKTLTALHKYWDTTYEEDAEETVEFKRAVVNWIPGYYRFDNSYMLTIDENGLVTRVGGVKESNRPLFGVVIPVVGGYQIVYRTSSYGAATELFIKLDDFGNLIDAEHGRLYIKDSVAFKPYYNGDEGEYLYAFTMADGSVVVTYAKASEKICVIAAVEGVVAPGEVITVTAGEKVIEVRLTDDGKFVYPSAEKGEYTFAGTEGGYGKIILNGLGVATINGEQYRYQIVGSIVKVKFGETEVNLELNTEENTYVEKAVVGYAGTYDVLLSYRLASGKLLVLDGYGIVTYTSGNSVYYGTYAVDEAGNLVISGCYYEINGTYAIAHDGNALRNADRTKEFVNENYYPTVDDEATALQGYYVNAAGDVIKIYYEYGYVWADVTPAGGTAVSQRPVLNWDGTILVYTAADLCSYDPEKVDATYFIIRTETGIEVVHTCTVEEYGEYFNEVKRVAYTEDEEPAFAFPEEAWGTWYLPDGTEVVITEQTIQIGGVEGTGYYITSFYYCFFIGDVEYDLFGGGSDWYCGLYYREEQLSRTKPTEEPEPSEPIVIPDGFIGEWKLVIPSLSVNYVFRITADGVQLDAYGDGEFSDCELISLVGNVLTYDYYGSQETLTLNDDGSVEYDNGISNPAWNIHGVLTKDGGSSGEETLDGLQGTYVFNDIVIKLDGKGNGTYDNGTVYEFTYSGDGVKKSVSNFAAYDDDENTITVTDKGLDVHLSGSYGDDVFNASFEKQAEQPEEPEVTHDNFYGTWSGKIGFGTWTIEFKDGGVFTANGTTYHYTVNASNELKAESVEADGSDKLYVFEIKSNGKLHVERYDADMCETYTGDLDKQ